MLYKIFDTFCDRLTSEHAKHTAVVLFNYMHNEMTIKTSDEMRHAYNIISIVHDIVTVNVDNTEDAIAIISLYNLIADFYNINKYRVLVDSDTMILTDDNEYTKYITDEIHDITDVSAYLTF